MVCFTTEDCDRQTLWQTTHRWYAWWLKLLPVRVMHTLHTRVSAHDLGVKLILYLRSHNNCPDW